MKVVVCDTGPILHLREAGVLDVLQHAGEIIIPAAVDDELRRFVEDWAAVRPAWLMRRPVESAGADALVEDHAVTGLGAGEAEAIVLARAIRADWLLTDDAEARVVGRLTGLEVHGSLGVVLWAAAHRHLDYHQADAALTGLAQSSLWLSPTILAEARAALQTLCAES